MSIKGVTIMVQLIEDKGYYSLDKTFKLGRDLYFFDAVKKVIRVYSFLEFFWVTCVGGVIMENVDNSVSFSNVFSFYVHNYFDNNGRDVFSNLSDRGLNFDFISYEHRKLEDYIESMFSSLSQNDLAKFNKDFVIGISTKIKEFNEFDINQFVELYTNKYMLYLESMIVFNFAKFLQSLSRSAVLISDGNLSKFNRFFNRKNKVSMGTSYNILENFNNVIFVGLIKDLKRNYLSDFGSEYLYSLPYSYRTSVFKINYEDFEVLSFYLNIGKIVRIEVLGEHLEELLNVANFIVNLSNLPSLYYRMPTNNIIFTKLERNLKNYIIPDVLFQTFS